MLSMAFPHSSHQRQHIGKPPFQRHNRKREEKKLYKLQTGDRERERYIETGESEGRGRQCPENYIYITYI